MFQPRDHAKSSYSQVVCVCIFLIVWQMSFSLFCCQGTEASVEAPSYDGTYTAMSLRVLSTKAAECLSSRSSVPRDLATLCGITRFESFLVDEGSRDVILIGKPVGGGSPLHLDELVVAMRSIWRGGTEAVSCSLDPRRENVLAIQQTNSQYGKVQTPEQGKRMIQQVKASWGPQLVRVGGVPKDSRYAHIMIDADYHLKKVSLGVLKISGVNSYLDMKVSDAKERIAQGEDKIASGMSFNRFWFNVEKEFPAFTEDEGIVWLKACPIVLFTEQQMGASSGELFDVDEDDPVATAYAKAFSEAFPRSADQVAPYADLRNLYFLKALLESMRFRQAAERVGLDMDVFLSQYACKTGTPMPDSMEGCVVNQEAFLKGKDGSTTYWFFPVTFGGVNMEMEVKEKNFEKDEKLKRVKSKVMQKRPSHDALFWHFTLP
jgi:hypothetical protein